jgi:aminopeptidase N
MMNRIIGLLSFTLLIAISSCSTSAKTNKTSDESLTDIVDVSIDPSLMVEERQLDTMYVTAPALEKAEETTEETAPVFEPEVYNASRKRRNDLLHTKLDLRFDWEEEAVIGTAELQLQPYFYPTDSLVLDAKGFDLQKISVEDANGQRVNHTYDYDEEKIYLAFEKEFKRAESYTITIEYIAHPSETGGSAAITSDKGLFFINPKGEDPLKPQQIWTQGETEWNSRWFPTIDSPNERCTQEMYLTVNQKYVTLSNGLLVSSTGNDDGTRTDYWKMDQPHAPYLFMIAVGEFAVVEDEWKDIPVTYYVEPEFEEDAPYIFPHTPEMLGFFSEKLGLDFPWKKYAQIVVRDYVSGAMENTTAVVFGDFMQKRKEELIDYLYNEKVVAHEMMHHWFGDYVTCESWANLTMNEGFANYSEYLWLEYKYGRDEADFHILSEWEGYLSSATYGGHPLIHFSYDNKEDMFDAHSYNKGGSVLHMLREYVGEEAFWAALNLYLNDNAYTSVEAHDLRLAFEEITGQDLNWFWNQWYFDQGHPVLQLNYNYQDSTGMATLEVSQVQNPEDMRPVFQIPTQVRLVYEDGSSEDRDIWVKERTQTFRFEVKEKPALMIFDPRRSLLCVVEEDNTPVEAYITQYEVSPSLFGRLDALRALRQAEKPELRNIASKALKDKFWALRGISLNLIEAPDPIEMKTIRDMAAEDPHSSIRASAFEKLIELQDKGAKQQAMTAIQRDSSEAVIASALYYLSEVDSAMALRYADQLKDTESMFILNTVAEMYVISGDTQFLPFFENRLEVEDMQGFAAVNFYDLYKSLLLQADMSTIEEGIQKLNAIATGSDQPQLRKAAGTISLFRMKEDLKEGATPLQAEVAAQKENLLEKLRNTLRTIKDRETDDTLLSIYMNITIE